MGVLRVCEGMRVLRVFSVVRVIYLRVCICCNDNEGIWVLMVIRVLGYMGFDGF